MEEVGLRAPLAQHLAGCYTHTVETTTSEALVQDEQRKTWTGTPAARQWVYGREIPLSTRRNSDKENHEIERELGN